MPLNRTNTKSSYRTAFAGITEYATYQRCGPDGNPVGAGEQWVCWFGPSTQAGESLGEGHMVTLRRTIKMFRRPQDKMQPPNVGDFLIRQRDGTRWEIPLESSIDNQEFGNSCYQVDVIQGKK